VREEEPTSTSRRNVRENDTITNASAAAFGATADPVDLFKELAGSCILLFGDSTDRQIIETWCPRWTTLTTTTTGKTELWSPRNASDGTFLDSTKLGPKIRDDGGWRCSPGQQNNGQFTFGNLMHCGVGPPPYWQFAHIHLKNVPANLEWGNSTWERVTLDIPQFFSDCEKATILFGL
jgi:hypothetical protein